MTVRLRGAVPVFEMLSTDRFPVPGELGQDGETPESGAWPEGTMLRIEDKGEQYIWLQERWHRVGDPLLAILKDIHGTLEELNRSMDKLVAQRGGQ